MPRVACVMLSVWMMWIDDVIAALQPPIDRVDAAAVAAVFERYASDSRAR